MSEPATDNNSEHAGENSTGLNSRISVPEIARRLGIGRLAVYSMLERGLLPGIRIGHRWLITRHAYEQWERTCGMGSRSGLYVGPEVMVLN